MWDFEGHLASSDHLGSPCVMELLLSEPDSRTPHPEGGSPASTPLSVQSPAERISAPRRTALSGGWAASHFLAATEAPTVGATAAAAAAAEIKRADASVPFTRVTGFIFLGGIASVAPGEVGLPPLAITCEPPLDAGTGPCPTHPGDLSPFDRSAECYLLQKRLTELQMKHQVKADPLFCSPPDASV